MDDGGHPQDGGERANAWRNVVLRRADDRASSSRALALWALFVAVAIHIAIFIALRGEMTRRAPDESPAVSVQLIDLFSAEPAASDIPPEPIPAPMARRSPRVMSAVTPSTETTFVAAPTATEDVAPKLNLYSADGRIVLPGNAPPRSDAIVARPIDANPVVENTIMVHIRPLKVRPNHFDASWDATHGGNPLDRFVADHLIKTTSIMRMPWGTRVQCAWIVIVAGCAWGPPDYWHGDQSWKPATMLDEQ